MFSIFFIAYYQSNYGHINIPGKTLTEAYKDPTTTTYVYWLYQDYYCHILEYSNGRAHVRIGDEDCWINQNHVEEVVSDAYTTSKTNIYAEPDSSSSVLGQVPTGSKITIYDFNINGYLRIKYNNIVGFIPSKASDFNYKPYPGNTDGERASYLVRTQLGLPYLWGRSGPEGYDCSGLMQWAYNMLDIFIHRTTYVQTLHGKLIEDAQDILPGDLILFTTDADQPNVVTHVGMYVGDGIFVHASTNGMRVREQDFMSYPYGVKTINRYWKE